ncbi:hypothetical protein E3E12_07140 [Formicincola oecophyllae]|uniref:PpiC domain-containing protein n=1 Tax=Formicincola oecophyllae TaxID=2558361 RepID=A0A4Y6UBP7_9PROT|nr:peptidylprolyl isomerase [Formicincola oecophyllae]QDH13988.1 hypothetical protein E3E12_07140 [Formicincola oecophyllae]
MARAALPAAQSPQGVGQGLPGRALFALLRGKVVTAVMITAMRRFFVGTWAGRLLVGASFLAFLGLGGTFVGMGGLGGDMGAPDAVIKVGKAAITAPELGQAIVRQVNYMRNQGAPLSALGAPAMRVQLANSALRQLILGLEVRRVAKGAGFLLGDGAIREAVMAMPEFKGADGRFDPARMNALLERSHLSHADLVKETSTAMLMGSIMAGMEDSATLPESLVAPVLRHYGLRVVVELARLPQQAPASVPAPAEGELERLYDNHKDDFRRPEYRHARIVIMTKETVGKTITVPEKTLRAIYDERKRDYNVPTTRSLALVNFPASDGQAANDLARAWRAKSATSAALNGAGLEGFARPYKGAVPVVLDDARQEDLPDAQLAQQLFKAPVGQVVGPVKTAAGWSVFRASHAAPPHVVTFEQARPKILDEVRTAQAEPALREHVAALQEAVASSTALDKVPADIGAVAASGEIDHEGRMEDGHIAPLPGSAALRRAIVRQIFSQGPGQPPAVIITPGGEAFAVLVDATTPSAPRSFEQARPAVLEAWQRQGQRHAQNERATALYLLARQGRLRQGASTMPASVGTYKAGVVFSRLARPPYPARVVEAAMALPVGHATMIEDDGAYWVLRATARPAMEAVDEEALRARLVARLNAGLHEDLLETLGLGYTREKPPTHFNPALFASTSRAALGQAGLPPAP